MSAAMVSFDESAGQSLVLWRDVVVDPSERERESHVGSGHEHRPRQRDACESPRPRLPAKVDGQALAYSRQHSWLAPGERGALTCPRCTQI